MRQLSEISVDVVVISYNHEAYIEQAITSLVKQNFPGKLRIIIGDDASRDNTPAICQRLYQTYPDRIMLLQTERNLGMMNNFIRVIEACTADYIAFCEGDDYWIDEDKLIKQVSYLEANNEYSLVFSNRIIVNDSGAYLKDDIYKKNIYSTEDVWEGFIAPTQAIVIRNLPGLGQFLKVNHNDYGGDRFLTLYSSFFGKLYKFEDKMAAYRDSGKGAWSSYTRIEKFKIYAQELKELHKIFGLPLNNEVMGRVTMNYIVGLNSYYIKRPFEYFKKGVFKESLRNWRNIKYLSRTRLLFKAIKDKLNRLSIQNKLL